MPKFEWRYVDGFNDEDWEEIEALDAWMAAKQAADKWDEEERLMIRNGHTERFEIKDADGKITKWAVWGEAQPYYYATPVKEEKHE